MTVRSRSTGEQKQAPGGNEQGMLSPEGRRLRETMADFEYERDHYKEEESGIWAFQRPMGRITGA